MKLGTLTDALAFHRTGEPSGNLTIGRGTLDGRAVHVALIENRTSSGAIGKVEAQRLAKLLAIVARERSPFVLFLDSAGARVSEGLRALGAFRALYRAGLQARLAGAPIAVATGRNCFGGASMLAHLAPRRLLATGGVMAMSGPSIIASAIGANALDETFRAIAEATLSATARAKASAANTPWNDADDIAGWLRAALAAPEPPLAAWRQLHDTLGARLPKPAAARTPEALQRRELEKLYPTGYDAQECDGLITGTGQGESGREDVLGLMTRHPVGADRAWRFAQAAWQLAERPATRVNVLLDCESHAATLDDERVVLSEYIAGMSFALAAIAARGAHVELTITGQAGGGVYVALAAPATRVLVEYGAKVRVLPGAAVAAILGADGEETPLAAESVAAGVADQEIKLGLV